MKNMGKILIIILLICTSSVIMGFVNTNISMFVKGGIVTFITIISIFFINKLSNN